MLYLKKFKNFKIILRGIPVEQFNIADEFRHPQTIMYKPQAAAMEYVIQTKTSLFLYFFSIVLLHGAPAVFSSANIKSVFNV